MATIPKTSVSLLNAIAASHASVRWTEFYDRYQPVMAAFIRKNYPSLETDEIIQEAMIAFMKGVPNYHYDPELKGSFHNYLIGIVKFKALEAFRGRVRETVKRDGFEEEMKSHLEQDMSDEQFDEAIANLAIRRFLDDGSVSMRDREVFRRTALQHERPESVAEAMGLTRNNVDQIKARALKKIREFAEKMKMLED